MGAGSSAAERARSARERALNLQREADRARAIAGQYEMAASTERRIVEQLGRLSAEGYHVLADRTWPGSSRANVDCVVVGPSGVFIVDPKCWAEVSIHQDRIYRGQDDVSEDFTALAGLGETTRSTLAEVGLPPHLVHVIAVLMGRADLCATVHGVEVIGERQLLHRIVAGGPRLAPGNVDTVLQACIGLFPVWSAGSRPPTPPAQRKVSEEAPVAEGAPAGTPSRNDTAPRPGLPGTTSFRSAGRSGSRAPEKHVSAAEPQLELLTDQELHEAVLDGIRRSPVEEWMAFLHPEQARLIRRTSAGPARIRGAAGTGKTVVGLHRAAWMARSRPGRILVTSYVRTIPQVLGALYASLSPGTVDRVDFVTVHALAREIVREFGEPVPLNSTVASREFGRAWSAVGKDGLLGESAQEYGYWQEEVSAVIKGRGLASLAEYQTLRRVGRRYPLTTEQRAAVWELYETYQGNLARAGVIDFDDLLITAESLVRENGPRREYTSVIVDEVQDITCVGVRLLHGLVGDRPDGLLLIGDGQQAIYAGGFTLAEAGVDVRGRSTVLKRNYRNTAEILAEAQRIVSGDSFGDLEDSDELGVREVEALRHGPAPTRAVFASHRDLEASLVRAVGRAGAEPGVGYGDIAVLLPTTKRASHYLRLLARERIPAMDLEKYAGTTRNQVKVGTYHRAKGLEFKHILLPEWESSVPAPGENESSSARSERLERARRTLFVAMTRARDSLWLGTVKNARAQDR